MIGTRLAHYEVTSHLGTGGMGEVYQASDSKLGRSVAIKLLPEAFANDPERAARFDREARVLASLNHPNIAAIYGIEESGPRTFLVMELVPGETLADKIKRGPIPLDEALGIASQITEALEAAHEKGVVHRDLKPANIKLTEDAKVKVLDFGLAKAFGGDTATANISNSPTMSLMATQQGIIMGTAAYMSPEQAKGREVDRRSDIFAFGAVLYEMLTGHSAFGGEDVADILGSVLKTEPDWTRLPANTSPRVRELLRLCLQKDAKKRRQTATDVRIDIEQALVEPVGLTPIVLPARSSGLGWIVAGGLALALIALMGWIRWKTAPVPDRPLARLSVNLGQEAVRGAGVSVILSPDGTRIVFMGRAEAGLIQLHTRRLDQTTATALSGTETEGGRAMPFFSPDGEWVGFRQTGKIKKVAVQGGTPVTLGDAPAPTALVGFGASWGDDNNIILGSVNGLLRLSATGGPARPLKDGPASEAVAQLFPEVLPGSKAALFNTLLANRLDDSDIGVLQFDTNQTKILIHGGYWPRYLATSAKTGYLVYVREGTLFGVGFDPNRLELLGTPTPLQDDIAANGSISASSGGQFAFSNTGTLVYLSGYLQDSTYPLQSLDAPGKTTPLVGQSGLYRSPRFSPDGKRLAYLAAGSKGSDVWVHDLDRGSSIQVTFLGVVNNEVAWARDSKHLVYSDGLALWWIRADGSGERQKLLDKVAVPRPGSFAPDGRLVFSSNTGTLPDTWTLPVDLTDPDHPKPGKAQPFLVEPAIVEVDATFSPDGKFIAYSSSELGGGELFVRAFPGPGGKWRVSMAGGKFPAWSGATHELLFLGNDDHIMAASYNTEGETFSAGTPRVWSPTPVLRTGVMQNFDVSPDGRRVVMMPRPAAEQTGGPLHATFLLNFFDEVRRRLPVGK